METLSDLSRLKPNADELAQVIAQLETESDRGCALIAASFLENTLELAILCKLAECNNKHRKSLLDGSNAPLGTFSSKILLARSLGITDEAVQKAFDSVRKIRNTFAHALRPLGFTHPTIVAECEKLSLHPMPIEDNGMPPARIRYAACCVAWSQSLFKVAEEQGGKEMDVLLTM